MEREISEQFDKYMVFLANKTSISINHIKYIIEYVYWIDGVKKLEFNSLSIEISWSFPNTKMSSCQYRDPRVNDKTVLSLTRKSHTWERPSIYWDGPWIRCTLQYVYWDFSTSEKGNVALFQN